MADTTKENVLIIAPELAITNIAQVNRIAVNTVTNNAVYSTTINDVMATYTSDGSATNLKIVAGLILALQTDPDTNADVSCLNTLDGTFLVTSKTAGTPFTVAVSSKLTATLDTANFDGDTLFDLILDDVKEELSTYGICTNYQEKAQRYLIAHLLTINNQSAIQGVSESIGRASVTYAGGDMFDPNMLKRTKYGAEFLRIYKKGRQLRGI